MEEINPVKSEFLIIASCISTGAVYAIKGKKLIGSAQCRKNDYILQLHGSILYDYNKTLLEQVFNEPVNTDEITTVKEINPDLTKKNP